MAADLTLQRQNVDRYETPRPVDRSLEIIESNDRYREQHQSTTTRNRSSHQDTTPTPTYMETGDKRLLLLMSISVCDAQF